MLLYLNSDFIKTQSKKSLQFINNLTLYCHISKKNLEEFKMAEEETAAPASNPLILQQKLLKLMLSKSGMKSNLTKLCHT